MDAAQRFFAAAMRDYGVQEGDHVRIPMRQCELARRRHVAASTVGAYLTAMGASIVSRRPDIVIRVASDDVPLADVQETPPAPTRELIAAIANLVEQQACLLNALAQTLTGAEQPRQPATEIRANEVLSRGFIAEKPQKEEEEALLPAPPRREPREATLRPRGSARIDALLEPLHAVTRQRGLVPMNDRDTIEAALAPYDDAIVRQLIDDLVCQARDGSPAVRSPFGLLVARARRGLVAATTPQAHDEPMPTPVPPVLEDARATDERPGRDMSDGVFELLAQYEQDETGTEIMRALDEAIAGEFTPASRQLLSPTTLRALRAETFRRHHDRRGGILAGREDAIGRDVSAVRPGTHPA